MTFRSIAPLAAVCLTIVIVDQVTKSRVASALGPGAAEHERWLIGNRVGLSYGENSGVAFGLLKGAPTAVFVLATAVVIAVICWFALTRVQNRFIAFAAAAVAGGAIGNLIDRARLGHVRDFIAVGPWPPFNVADASITIGVSLALIAMWELESTSSRSDGTKRKRGVEDHSMAADGGN